ncbi:MAG: glycogen synthase GlgA [Cardiobacteriaceae bacterium]|nr:glycogen synthase GlgA [Cardiobacteriaceae bacterium]
MKILKILHVCSELFPLVKTGGLADVMGALPLAQRTSDMDVRVVLPLYPQVAEKIGETGHVGYYHTFAGDIELRYTEYRGVGIYLIDAPHLYQREGNPYHDQHYADYGDNYLRFALLGWVGASLAAGADSWWKPDLLHGHDWQAGLAFAYLRAWDIPIKTVFTIHNLAYAGIFSAHHLTELGLPSYMFGTYGLEFYGQISYLKAGLYYADHITTVSPSYAREIMEPEHGYGFHGLLQERAAQGRLSGILNGVDDNVWNPESDVNISKPYKQSYMQGKRVNKHLLQQAFNLPTDDSIPLLVMITRLTEQKGADILLGAAESLLSRPLQLAILGTGSPDLEHAFRDLAGRHPDKVGVRITYNEGLSHQMIAGGDVILVPSRFEPCGLTQLYGLKYGTLPLVRATGGLADTVVDTTKETVKARRATGFVFYEAAPDALLQAAGRMLESWKNTKQWAEIRSNAMNEDFSWHKAAQSYQELYQRL